MKPAPTPKAPKASVVPQKRHGNGRFKRKAVPPQPSSFIGRPQPWPTNLTSTTGETGG